MPFLYFLFLLRNVFVLSQSLLIYNLWPTFSGFILRLINILIVIVRSGIRVNRRYDINCGSAAVFF